MRRLLRAAAVCLSALATLVCQAGLAAAEEPVVRQSTAEPVVRHGIDDRPYILRLGSASTDVAIGGYFDLVGSYLQQQGVSDGFSGEARRFNIFITSKIADRIR